VHIPPNSPEKKIALATIALLALGLFVARRGRGRVEAHNRTRRRYLSALRDDADRIARHLAATRDDPVAAAMGARLRRRLRATVFAERRLATSLGTAPGRTIGKGRAIVLCLDATEDDDGASPPSAATHAAISQVLYHELAHVASVSVGHTAEFWVAERRIVEAAVALGLYRRRHGARAPLCGRHIRLSA